MLDTVLVEKLVHGGQGLGVLADGRKILVWNALPGEKVKVKIIKNKTKYAEGIAEQILDPSQNRIEPKDEAYLSSSPWQIMNYESENISKQEILTETYTREKVIYPAKIELIADRQQWHYRTKMEYSFWADDNGIHLALYNRGTHNKRIVPGSSIARPEIDSAANSVCIVLNKNQIRGSQLKTIIIRCSQNGNCVVSLFVKDKNFKKILELETIAKGLVVYYSDPKSPASVQTKELYSFGNTILSDTVLGNKLNYDVNSFFQVNLPVFERALSDMKPALANISRIVDFYSGVGTIGVILGASLFIESDQNNINIAKLNLKNVKSKIIKSTLEKSLDKIPDQGAMIVDPPRAGLHSKVIDRLLLYGPDKIIYLSCNPITHARDLSVLQDIYKIDKIIGYNFFPKTPHIESLSILSKK